MRHLLPIGFIVLCFLVFSTGCSWFRDDVTIVDNVEPEFNLDLVEKLDAPYKPIQIRVATLKEQNCKAIIHNNAFRNGRTISFNINQWSADEPCTEEMKIQDTLITIDVLTPGTYDLKVRVASDLYSDGTLTVTPDRYLFECQKPLGFVIERTEMLRVPDDLIWGYVAFSNAKYSSDADLLVQELGGMNKEANIKSGNYGHFVMENRTTITLPGLDKNLPVSKAFIFVEKLSDEEISGWVNKLHQAYPGAISLHLVNSQGKTWY